MGEPETRGQRIYLIREALGTRRDPMPLEQFAELIERQTGTRYSKSVLSRKETGEITVSLEDIEAIAPVDPLKRGKAWLAGWDDERGGDSRTGDPVPEIPVVNRTIEKTVYPPDDPPAKGQSVKGTSKRRAMAG